MVHGEVGERGVLVVSRVESGIELIGGSVTAQGRSLEGRSAVDQICHKTSVTRSLVQVGQFLKT